VGQFRHYRVISLKLQFYASIRKLRFSDLVVGLLFRLSFSVSFIVNRKFRYLSLAGLFAFYVILLGLHVGHYSSVVHESQANTSEMAFLEYDSSSFALIPISESRVHVPVTPAGPSSGTNSIYLDIELSIDHLIASTNLSYIRNYVRVPIRFRKSDLIFPFHTFW